MKIGIITSENERHANGKIKAKDEFFQPMITSLLAIINANGREPFIDDLILMIRSINLGISRVEFETKEFGQNVKNAHATILQSTDEKKCTHEDLKDLKDWILESISS